jgi:NAD-dependent SIR2 family protein deacetylase
LKQLTLVKEGTEHDDENCRVPGCEGCKLRKPFELPSEIISACEKAELVIFAGAGVSTESPAVFPSTFCQMIQDKLKLSDKGTVSFSKIMTVYSSEPRSRKDLLKAIKERIDYTKSFPELYRAATRFHREISTIPHLNEIFTTNWDDFFEIECGATPIVTGEDYAVLQDIQGRIVFKLHGSINNYGSIIATEEDYRKCYRRLSTGIVGAKLKTLLVSKTIVFLGFSFDDEDFKKLYHLLSKDVAGLIPRLFVVTLDEKAKDKLDSLGIKATPIVTDATFFVQKLKKKLVETKLMVPDEQYDGIRDILAKVLNEHKKLSKELKVKKHPDAIYSLFYQDGLIHSFERLLANKKTGDNSCGQHVFDCITEYETMRKNYLHEKAYGQVAYVSGFLAGMIYFLVDKNSRKSPPFYFLFGCGDIKNYDEFVNLLKEAQNFHKSAHAFSKKIGQNLESELLTPHKRPFL